MTSVREGIPPSLLHNVRHNRVVPETTLILTAVTSSVPHMSEQSPIERLEGGLFRCSLTYGFMDTPNVPRSLEPLLQEAFACKTDQELTYFVGRETHLSTRKPGMARWRKRLFAVMARNSERATDYFRLPATKVFEIGIMIEL